MTSSERGSAAVEAVLVAPVLLVLLALLVAGGLVTSDEASLDAVAREAARVAIMAPDSATAVREGSMRAQEVARGYRLDPSRLRVIIDPGSFARGGSVTVRATYSESLAGLPSLGLLPQGTELTATHVEPINRYASR